MNSVAVRAEFRASDITVQLRDYAFASHVEQIANVEPAPTFALRLSKPPRLAQGHHDIGIYDERYMDLGVTMFHPPEIPVTTRGSGGEIKVATCSFSADRFEDLTGFRFAALDARRLRACLDIRSASIGGALRRLAQEAAAPGFATDVVIEGLGVSLMGDLARYFHGTPAGAVKYAGQLARWQMRRIKDRIAQESCPPPNLSELSGLCGVGPDHLGRLFKRTTGQTLSQHIEQERAARAIALLTSTDLALKEIAFRLGFPGQSGFSIAFRRWTGQRPTDYRRQFGR
jgi:AraC family transcriptional regulator